MAAIFALISGAQEKVQDVTSPLNSCQPALQHSLFRVFDGCFMDIKKVQPFFSCKTKTLIRLCRCRTDLNLHCSKCQLVYLNAGRGHNEENLCKIIQNQEVLFKDFYFWARMAEESLMQFQ